MRAYFNDLRRKTGQFEATTGKTKNAPTGLAQKAMVSPVRSRCQHDLSPGKDFLCKAMVESNKISFEVVP